MNAYGDYSLFRILFMILSCLVFLIQTNVYECQTIKECKRKAREKGKFYLPLINNNNFVLKLSFYTFYLLIFKVKNLIKNDKIKIQTFESLSKSQ